MNSENTVLSLSRLVKLVKKLKGRGKRVAFTNGCFDLLHVGHVEYLERIKQRADILIVGVNSDSSVRQLNKGSGRPIVPAKERARLVAAFKPVDYVTIFSETTPWKLIQTLRPDLLAKGGDWEKEKIVGHDLVETYGGKVLVLPYKQGFSTTRLIERIRRLKAR